MTDDPVAFVMEKPIRAAILAALENVSFLSPGRDFKTIVVAMQATEWNKTYPEEIDQPAAVANLGQLHKLGLVKKTRRPNGKRVFVKGQWIDQRASYWRLTNEGHTVLADIRRAIADGRLVDPDLREGGSGGHQGGGSAADNGSGRGRPVALPEGVPGRPESGLSGSSQVHDSPAEDQRGHQDDAGRPGADPEPDGPEAEDPDRYDYSYRHRLGD